MEKVTFEEIERLIDKFKWERYFHLIIIAACTLIIIIVAILLLRQKDNWPTALSLLAPGGTIFFCLSRVFKMWDDVMSTIKTNNGKDE
ncbi:cytochrome bd-type quinol oxidase subunit 2 [Chryseobacterium ginsenosidimutans]|uniref:hypothetical protein n=1 Tax=Chryseobacterium ginsenosidimutans TaxID=687846 RepID=UPI0021672944|nr:hypothetical protein [Chryseobacterium ginsenosidimutans]MCS3869719.1 cytochrome bd-type quinol oxidase subunit 2 [Chryseobacterium ginsenosidimutans]